MPWFYYDSYEPNLWDHNWFYCDFYEPNLWDHNSMNSDVTLILKVNFNSYKMTLLCLGEKARGIVFIIVK